MIERYQQYRGHEKETEKDVETDRQNETDKESDGKRERIYQSLYSQSKALTEYSLLSTAITTVREPGDTAILVLHTAHYTVVTQVCS